MDDLGLPMGVFYAAVTLPLAVFAAWWMGFIGPSSAVAEPAVAPPPTSIVERSVAPADDTSRPTGVTSTFDGSAGAGTADEEPAALAPPELVLVDGATSIAGVGPAVVSVAAHPVGTDTITLSTPGEGRMTLVDAAGGRRDLEVVAGAEIVASIDPAAIVLRVDVEVDGPWALAWSSRQG